MVSFVKCFCDGGWFDEIFGLLCTYCVVVVVVWMLLQRVGCWDEVVVVACAF